MCEQHYLPMPVCEGGGGGDVTRICADIINAVLDQHSVQVLDLSLITITDILC